MDLRWPNTYRSHHVPPYGTGKLGTPLHTYLLASTASCVVVGGSWSRMIPVTGKRVTLHGEWGHML
jgi:hypothetical protein